MGSSASSQAKRSRVGDYAAPEACYVPPTQFDTAHDARVARRRWRDIIRIGSPSGPVCSTLAASSVGPLVCVFLREQTESRADGPTDGLTPSSVSETRHWTSSNFVDGAVIWFDEWQLLLSSLSSAQFAHAGAIRRLSATLMSVHTGTHFLRIVIF